MILSHLIPDELWDAALELERVTSRLDDTNAAMWEAARLILDDRHFATVVAALPADTQKDWLLQRHIALIRRYTAPVGGDPLARSLPM